MFLNTYRFPVTIPPVSLNSPNDNFANAVEFIVKNADTDSGSIPGNNFDATFELNEWGQVGNQYAAISSIWYKFTALASGVIVIDTLGSTVMDTVLKIFTLSDLSSQPPTEFTLNQLVLVMANDDGPGFSNYESQLTLLTDPGTTYFISVDQYGDVGASHDYGTTMLNWAFTKSY